MAIGTFLAMTGLVAGANAPAIASPTVTSDSRPALALDEPGVQGLPGARTVTLLTGQQVTVSSDPSGRVTVTPSGAGGVRAAELLSADGPTRPPELAVTGFEEPGKPTVLSAVPPSATALVDSGAIDRALFDLNTLATRGFGVASTPVTVHFDGVTTAAESKQSAEALPASTYVPGTATSGRATVAVPVATSKTFWDAVTKPHAFDPASPEGQVWAHNREGAPRDLADGLAGLTLDGAPLASAPASVTPNYQLTVRVHASEDPARWARGEELGIDLTTASAPLIGVTGPSAGSLVNPSFSCLGSKPVCGTVVLTYSVPAGVYYLAGRFQDTRDTILSTTFFEEPEVAVFGNRVIDLNMDDGIWIAPRTPKASDLAGYGISMRRSLPDGRTVYNLSTRYGELGTGYSLAPTQNSARTGAYNMKITHEWHEPYVTLTTDRGLDLKARYPLMDFAPGSPYPMRPELSLRDTRLGIVDAGTGTAADFAAIDAKGKLVVLGPNPDQVVPCGVELQVMKRAIAAGAAGVVFDPRTDRYPTGVCNVFLEVHIVEGKVLAPIPDLPLMSIQPDEARQLRKQLTERKVAVRVDSPGQAAMGYIYELTNHFSGGVPSSIDQTVTSDALATRQTTLRDTAGRGSLLAVQSWYPEFMLSMNWAFGLFPTTTPGRRLTEYLSVSRDAKWQRRWGGETAEEIVTRNDARPETWFAKPQSLGPHEVPSERGTWTDWALCSFCRAGDELSPFTEIGSPEGSHLVQTGLLPAMVLTDAQGQQIPLTSSSQGVPRFQLPPQTQRYILVSTMPAGDRFEWQFTSGNVSGEHKPVGTYCANEILGLGVCGAAQPLIYLRYAAPLDDANTAAAATRHKVTITPYHQEHDAPGIRQVATQVSFDGGTTWTPASMKPLKNGSWTATFAVPPLAETNGFVTLRTTASDDADNTTDQLRPHAYRLR